MPVDMREPTPEEMKAVAGCSAAAMVMSNALASKGMNTADIVTIGFMMSGMAMNNGLPSKDLVVALDMLNVMKSTVLSYLTAEGWA